MSEFISAQTVMERLGRFFPDGTVYIGDDGSHSFYAIRYLPMGEHNWFIFDDVFGAMGQGIGLAIGASLAYRERPVVCITGDGCFFMHGNEIATACEEGANLWIIIINNQALDMVDKGMKRHVGRSVATTYTIDTQLATMATAMGALAKRITTIEDLEETLFAWSFITGPKCLEVMVDPFEIPPTMKRG